MDRLRNYADLLRRWTTVINLVSTRDAEHVWTRHVEDSLRLLPLLPPGLDRGVDLGSGGGLPAIPLAIVSGIPFDLIESDQRKATFLREAARLTASPITVHCERIEHATVAPAALVTARALAPLPKLLDYAARFLQPGATCLFPKGANAAAELADASQSWTFQHDEYADPANPESLVLALRNVRHV